MSHETILDRHVGPDALEVWLNGTVVDPTKLGPVTMRHGRVDVDTQPTAATLTLTVLAGALDEPPVIGDDLVVDLGDDGRAALGVEANLTQRDPRAWPVSNGAKLANIAPGVDGWRFGAVQLSSAAFASVDAEGIAEFTVPAGVTAVRIAMRARTLTAGGRPVLALMRRDGASWVGVEPYAHGEWAYPAVGDYVVREQVVPVTVGWTCWLRPHTAWDTAAVGEVGDLSATYLRANGDPVRRFVGSVTDVRARLDGQGRAVYAISATSPRARLGRTFVGDVPWPAELDGARASRILALVDPLVDVAAGLDPGTVQVVARDVDRQAALQLLDDLAADTNAQLVETRAGQLDWHDAEHRRNIAATATLDASQVLSPAEWAQTLSGVVNDLTVVYGTAEPKAEVRIVDQASVDAFGPFASRIDTQLADAAAAESFANLTLARRSRPWWRLDKLDVDLTRTVTPVQAAALLALNQADRLDVTGFPAAGPFTTTKLWVEGWTETITAKAWRLSLNVAQYGVLAAPVRWVDVPVHVTWADVDASLTWLQAAAWDPGDPGEGRWVDYPSDVAWLDLADDLTTWASWP